MLDSISQGIVLIATGLSAYTDYKTGLIYDWITYPLIVIGILLRLWQQDWIGLGIGIATFALLYGLYYTGKLGGGDVKLFTGIALTYPFQQNQVFLLNVVFFAALSALLFYSFYYLYRIKKEKIQIDWNENKSQTRLAILLSAFIFLFTAFLVYNNGISLYVGIGLIAVFWIASAYIAVETTAKKHFLLSHIQVDELEEDEIVATEFMDSKLLEQSGLNVKKIIGENEKTNLKNHGITQVPVYRNAPRFGPFIFIGTLLAITLPEFFAILFLGI